jgi:uncharacterized membrane protein YbhN (UPF0104 family)
VRARPAPEEPSRPAAARPARRWLSILFAVAVTAVLVAVILRRRDEFSAAVSSASLWVLAVATLLQVVAIVVRTEAWHVCVRAAGGTVLRRPLYRAAGLGYLGSQLNAQVGTAARVAALRKANPGEVPPIPALVAAEVPIIVVELAFGAIASFTLVGPLGLPWWVPIVLLVAAAAMAAALGRVSRAAVAGWRTGLAVLTHLRGRNEIIGLMVVAIVAQVLRNWLMLHAVGVDASVFDATAVLIAQANARPAADRPGRRRDRGRAHPRLGRRRRGGRAAGVLLTATGTLGALLYVAWSGADSAWVRRRRVPAARAAAPG